LESRFPDTECIASFSVRPTAPVGTAGELTGYCEQRLAIDFSRGPALDGLDWFSTEQRCFPSRRQQEGSRFSVCADSIGASSEKPIKPISNDALSRRMTLLYAPEYRQAREDFGEIRAQSWSQWGDQPRFAVTRRRTPRVIVERSSQIKRKASNRTE